MHHICIICGEETHIADEDYRQWTCNKDECHETWMALPGLVHTVIFAAAHRLDMQPQQLVVLVKS